MSSSTRQIRSWGILCLLVALLAACAPIMKPVPVVANRQQAWRAYQKRLSTINHWQLNAKVGGHIAKKPFSVNLYWQQRGTNYHLTFSGPLGIGASTLSSVNGQAEFVDRHGKIYRANTPEELMQAHMGWSVPVSDLYYWVRGLRAPYSEAVGIKLNAYGLLSKMKQDQWTIEYLKYARFADQVLPSQMRLRDGNIFCVLSIYQWKP